MMGYEFLIRLGFRALPYALVLGLGWGVYHQGQLAERRAAELATAKGTITVLEGTIRRNALAAAEAQAAATARSRKEQELTEKVRDYEIEIAAREAEAKGKSGKPTRHCVLDGADIKRLRGLR